MIHKNDFAKYFDYIGSTFILQRMNEFEHELIYLKRLKEDK